jgi:chemotaxis response regulator CheB
VADVILLDIEMPRMDGITFLQQMATRPTPVVMCSSRAEDGNGVAAAALAAGAVSVTARPQLGVRDFLHEAVAELACAIRALYRPGRPHARLHQRRRAAMHQRCTCARSKQARRKCCMMTDGCRAATS